MYIFSCFFFSGAGYLTQRFTCARLATLPLCYIPEHLFSSVKKKFLYLCLPASLLVPLLPRVCVCAHAYNTCMYACIPQHTHGARRQSPYQRQVMPSSLFETKSVFCSSVCQASSPTHKLPGRLLSLSPIFPLGLQMYISVSGTT